MDKLNFDGESPEACSGLREYGEYDEEVRDPYLEFEMFDKSLPFVTELDWDEESRRLPPSQPLRRTPTARSGAPAGLRPSAPGPGSAVTPPQISQVRPFVVLEGFKFDRDSLPTTHRPIITRIAHLVVASQGKRQSIGTIRLVGHADPVGRASYNRDLARRRAVATRNELIREIEQLSPGLSRKITIVPQTLGEARPIASSRTSAGRSRNRRVEVFLPATCQGFLAQYALRFMTGNRIFGIPANPNMTAADKRQRIIDVNLMVDELLKRRDQRASDALAGRVSRASPVQGSLAAVARRLSTAQLQLYREFFSDGTGGIDFAAFQDCFEQFANGELRSPNQTAKDQGVGEPNSGFFFLFSEFAFLCIDTAIDAATWILALKTFVETQEIFMHAYRPAPVVAPPAVNARLPACPVDRQGRRRRRLTLDAFDNSNFNLVGKSSQTGKGRFARSIMD